MPTKWCGFRSLLCPVDFSEHSRLALKFAAAVARRSNATLTVMYANDPLLVTAAAVALDDRDLVKRSADELRAFVDATLGANATDPARFKSLVSVGPPADEIIRTAMRQQSDLIVMGTHGLTGVDRVLIGSTTLAVLRRTRVPVLAVPRQPRNAVPRLWPGRNILAAIDLDQGATGDVAVAAELARWWETSVLLVHAIGDLSADDRTRICRAQRRIDELTVAARRRVPARARVICGPAPDGIAALAAAEGSGLVITALRDRRGWFGPKRGALSYQVLSHAVTPVLARPPQWRPR